MSPRQTATPRWSSSLPLTETVLTRWVDPTPFVPHNQQLRAERCELILKMQADGLAKRLDHAHAKTAVIGISGGLDSCLALLVAVRAMKQLGRPATDVLAVTMPCFGTTHRTRSNAEILCDELDVSLPGDRHRQYRPQPFCRHRAGRERAGRDL